MITQNLVGRFKEYGRQKIIKSKIKDQDKRLHVQNIVIKMNIVSPLRSLSTLRIFSLLL